MLQAALSPLHNKKPPDDLSKGGTICLYSENFEG